MLPQSLPGIRRIYTCHCSSLPSHLMLSAICGGTYAMYRSALTPVPFAGHPTYRREGTVMNNSRAEKSTLEFRTGSPLPEDVRLAIVVECVNGQVWLIGTREPNYPVIEYTDSSGSPGGDPAVRTCKVTHTDIKSGLPVLL